MRAIYFPIFSWFFFLLLLACNFYLEHFVENWINPLSFPSSSPPCWLPSFFHLFVHSFLLSFLLLFLFLFLFGNSLSCPEGRWALKGRSIVLRVTPGRGCLPGLSGARNTQFQALRVLEMKLLSELPEAGGCKVPRGLLFCPHRSTTLQASPLTPGWIGR